MIFDLSQSIKVCIFSLITIENMSQQQINAKFKSQNANLDCRFCLISSDHRDDLNYDIIQNDKFHHQIMKQRNEMNKLRFIARKKIFASKWNLFVEQSILIQLFSIFDIIVIVMNSACYACMTQIQNWTLWILWLEETNVRIKAFICVFASSK